MALEQVVLLGASGTMGFFAFKELWRRRERYSITLLLRPSRRNRKLFGPYVRQAANAAPARPGSRAMGSLRIVWGDATSYHDLERALHGADWVLDAMALISPQADYHPARARAVNTEAIRNLVRAIEAQPGGADRIKLVYTGTVAETGDRLDCIHVGRVGDPVKVAAMDAYAASKVAGEWAVLESNLRRWVSLRLTYIMPTEFRDYLSLVDPILFHMPLKSFMENISDRDAGFGLVQCLELGDDDGFWRRVYNMGGGPAMRCTAYEYLSQNFRFMGMSGVEAVTERRWFALRNFHLQYYDDSSVLNSYLHHWRDSLESYWQSLRADMPSAFRAVTRLCRALPPFRRLVERSTRLVLRMMAERHRNGTAYWYRHRNDRRISAFFRDYASYEAIPSWGEGAEDMDGEPACQRLHHGYDEAKPVLDVSDLESAARFRGGRCLSEVWDGDLYAPVRWECASGHPFSARPYTVLKAGHWCPDCVPPPWRYDEEARRNPFFAQVWYTNHDPDENNVYPEESIYDVAVSRNGSGRALHSQDRA